MAFGVQIEKNKFENILGAKMPFYHNGCGCNSRFLHTAVAQIAAAEGWTYFDILKHDKILRGIARPIVSNTSWHTQEILKSFIMLEEKDTRVTNLLTKYFTEQIGYTYDERTFRCGNKSDNDYYLFNKTSGDIPSFPHQTAILYADNTFQNLLAELKEKRLSLLKNRPP
jgi:hypothetical protein